MEQSAETPLDSGAEVVAEQSTDTSVDTSIVPETTESEPSLLEGEESEVEESDEEIDYEGAKYKVPKVLKDAFLRQQDYTQKTQSVAEQRREVEAQVAQFQQAQQIHQQNIAEYAEAHALDSQLQQFSSVNWQELIESDPVQAMKLDRQMREMQQRRDQVVSSITQKQQQQALQSQQEMAKRLQEGRTVLEREIKGWSPEVAKQLNSYGQEFGFTPEDMSSVSDPRMVKVLHKAWQFDQLVKKQATQQQPATQEKPITRITASKGVATKNPSEMTDHEFNKWRRSQISKRN